MATLHLLKISRLEGLTDGIFAIAMTLLILDLRLPLTIGNTDLITLLQHDILVKLFIYIGSFVILGTLWVAMNFQLGLLEKVNRPYLWANIFYLMAICVVPFSANLLGTFPKNPVSIYFYAINLLFAFLGQFIVAHCSYYFQLNKDGCTVEVRRAIIKRILVAPIFYVISMVIAPWNIKIAFITLIAPTLLYMIPGRVDRYEGISQP